MAADSACRTAPISNLNNLDRSNASALDITCRIAAQSRAKCRTHAASLSSDLTGFTALGVFEVNFCDLVARDKSTYGEFNVKMAVEE